MSRQSAAVQTSVELEGTIDRIVFRGETGFAIARLRCGRDGREIHTVKGNLGKLAEEDDVRVTGTWIEDKKYGKQFEVLAARPVIPTEAAGVARWLAKNIDGLGEKRAKQLVDRFGKDAVQDRKSVV